MTTTFKAAVDSYLRAKTLSRGTHNEYRSTVRKWEQWGGGSPIEALEHKEIREFLDWVHEHALAEQGTNPGRTANKAREHLRGPLLGVGAGTDRGAAPRPWAEGAARRRWPALPDEGRDQRPLLRDPPDEATPGLGQPVPRGAVLAGRARRVLQLRGRYGYGLEVGPLSRAGTLASCYVGALVAGSRTQGAVAVGVAVLPPGEDGQEFLPADESRRARAPQEHPAGERVPDAPVFLGGERARTLASKSCAPSPALGRGQMSRLAGTSRGS